MKLYASQLDQYLQTQEGRTNIAAVTGEDDTKEYHGDTDRLKANPINLKTSQGFSDVESVDSDNSEIQNGYKVVTKLSKNNKKDQGGSFS